MQCSPKLLKKSLVFTVSNLVIYPLNVLAFCEKSYNCTDTASNIEKILKQMDT